MQRAEPGLDVAADFPVLSQRTRSGKRLVYLDSASTSQKPRHVIDAVSRFEQSSYSNIHRAVYDLAEDATAAYEAARDRVAAFIRAPDRRGVVFTRGTTEAINLVAYSWGREHVGEGDVIVTTEYEHHSNIVPWQLLAAERGARVEYVRVDDDGELDLSSLDEHLSTGRVRMVAFSLMSNVLGTVSDARAIVSRCRAAGAATLADAAQSVPHSETDVGGLGCDFVAFSGHKMMAPTGIGVLWAVPETLESMRPFHGGGDMIREVHKEGSTWNDLPYKFEAGTPAISQAVGLGAAVEYIESVGISRIAEHERGLTAYALARLAEVRGLRVYGRRGTERRGGVISFNFHDVHPHDVAQISNEEGIAVRSGHHCAQILMQRLGVAATSRASLYAYNTREDIDALVGALGRVARMFKVG